MQIIERSSCDNIRLYVIRPKSNVMDFNAAIIIQQCVMCMEKQRDLCMEYQQHLLLSKYSLYSLFSHCIQTLYYVCLAIIMSPVRSLLNYQFQYFYQNREYRYLLYFGKRFQINSTLFFSQQLRQRLKLLNKLYFMFTGVLEAEIQAIV